MLDVKTDFVYGSPTEATPVNLVVDSNSPFTITPNHEVDSDSFPAEDNRLGVVCQHHERMAMRQLVRFSSVLTCRMPVGRLYPCSCKDNIDVVSEVNWDVLPRLINGFESRWAFICRNVVEAGRVFVNETVIITPFPGDILSEVMSFLYPWDIHPIFTKVKSSLVAARAVEVADDTMIMFGLTHPVSVGIGESDECHPHFCWGISSALDEMVWTRTTRVYVPDLTRCGDVESNPGPWTFKTYIARDSPSRVEKFNLCDGYVATPSLKFAFYASSQYKGTQPRISKSVSQVGTKEKLTNHIERLPNHLAGCTCNMSYRAMAIMKRSSSVRGYTLTIEPNEYQVKRYVIRFQNQGELDEMLHFEVSCDCPCGRQFMGKCLATKSIHVPHYEYMAREKLVSNFWTERLAMTDAFRDGLFQSTVKMPLHIHKFVNNDHVFEAAVDDGDQFHNSGERHQPSKAHHRAQNLVAVTTQQGLRSAMLEAYDASLRFENQVQDCNTSCEPQVVSVPSAKRPGINDIRSQEGQWRRRIMAEYGNPRVRGLFALQHRQIVEFLRFVEVEKRGWQSLVDESKVARFIIGTNSIIQQHDNIRNQTLAEELDTFKGVCEHEISERLAFCPTYTDSLKTRAAIERSEHIRRNTIARAFSSILPRVVADSERQSCYRSETSWRSLYENEESDSRSFIMNANDVIKSLKFAAWRLGSENLMFKECETQLGEVAISESAHRTNIEKEAETGFGALDILCKGSSMILSHFHFCLNCEDERTAEINADKEVFCDYWAVCQEEQLEANARSLLIGDEAESWTKIVNSEKLDAPTLSKKVVDLMKSVECVSRLVTLEDQPSYFDVSVVDDNATSCHKILAKLFGVEEIGTPTINADELFKQMRGMTIGLTFITKANKKVIMQYHWARSKDVHVCLYLNEEMQPVHVSAHLILDHIAYRSDAELTNEFMGMTFGQQGVGGLRDYLNRFNREYSDTKLAHYRTVNPLTTAPANFTPKDPDRRGVVQSIRGAFRTRHHESNCLQADQPPGPGLQFLHFANCRVVLEERPIKFAPAFPSLYTYESVLDHNGSGRSKQFEHFKCNCYDTHRLNALNSGNVAIARVREMRVVDRGQRPNFLFRRPREERITVHSETTISCHPSHHAELLATLCTARNATNNQFSVNVFTDKLANSAVAQALAPGAQAQDVRNALIRAGSTKVEDLPWLSATLPLICHVEIKKEGTFSETVIGTFMPSTVPCRAPFATDDIRTTIGGFHYPAYSACCHTSRKTSHCSACMNARLCSQCGRCITKITLHGLNSLQRAVRAYCGFCSEGDPIVRTWKCIRDDTSTTIIPPLGVYPMVSTVFSRTPALKRSDLGAGVRVNVLTEVHAGKQAGPQAVGVCPVAISPICTVLDTVNMMSSLSSRQLASQITPDTNAVMDYTQFSEKFLEQVVVDLQECGYMGETISPKRMSAFLMNYHGPKRQRYADALSFCMKDDARRKICHEVNCEFREINQLDLKNTMKDMFQRSIFLKNEMLNKTTCPYEPNDNAGRVITSCTSPVPNVVLGPWIASAQAILKRYWSIEDIPRQTSKIKVLFACGKDCTELGDMYAYAFNNYKFLVGLDYKKYDSNQKSFHHHVEGYFYKRLGFGRAAMRCFHAQAENRATASIRGVKVIRATWRWRRNSGDPNTTCGNSVLNVTMLAWAIEKCAKKLGIDPADFLICVGGDDGMIASQHPPEIWQPMVDAILHKELGMPLAWQLSTDPWTIRFMGALPYPVEGGAIRTGPCFERFISKIGYMCTPSADVLGWMKGVAECWMSSFSHVPFIPAFCEPMLRTSINATANYKKDGFLYAQSTKAPPVRAAPESLDVMRRQLLDIGVSTTVDGIIDMLETVRTVQHLPILISHPILNMVGQVSYDL